MERYELATDLAASVPTAADIRIRPNPAGAVLPSSFTQQYGRLSEILGGCVEGSVCEARMLDLDRDGAMEVVVAAQRSISVFRREQDGRWFEWAEYLPPTCAGDAPDVAAAFGVGRFSVAPPVFPDFIVDGVRFRHVEGEPECPVSAETSSTPAPAAGGEQHGKLTAAR